ncbi:hypothetical protein BURPS1710b_A2129 [Burkholderia pseudomallei 1710b]|uniref:Uncharacterized protein n=1 Tax=Burkholderia pseudomallei (strain 1710b) TaxID=320372 RepID=Q3JGM4_BURP1|nr:hypothetical protein BURPS1710b_A2129 [Burkholderia pseudomallei 1710b]
MTHAGLAARQCIREERAHERPADARAETDRIVDLARRRDAFVDEMQRLAPQRFEQAIGDEARHFLAHAQRPHAERAIDAERRVDGVGRGALAAQHFDERQQIDRIERMPDDAALGTMRARVEIRRQQARRRRRDDRIGLRRATDPLVQFELQRLALGRAFLHEIRVGDARLDRRHEMQACRRRARRQAGALERGPCVLDVRAQLHFRTFGGIPREHVEPVRERARNPAAADDARADRGERVDFGDDSHVLSILERERHTKEPRRRDACAPGRLRHVARPSMRGAVALYVFGHRAPLERPLAARRQAELAAPLGGRQHARAETLDDLPRTLDERAVRRVHAAVEPQVVLEADAHVAAEQHRLREHRHLHPADAEARPMRAGRQVVDHRLHRAGVGGRAPRNAEAELEERRIVEEPFLQQLLREPQVARVEDLELRLHAQRLDPLRARAQLRGRRHVDVIAVAEIQRAAIERADLGQQFLDMHEPRQPADEVRALAEAHRVLARADLEIAAHAGRQIDDDVDVGRADPVDHLAVQPRIAAAAPRERIAHVAMRDRRARLRGLDRRIGDLLGRDGYRGMLANGVARTRHRACHNHFLIHRCRLVQIRIRIRRVAARRRARARRTAPFRAPDKPSPQPARPCRRRSSRRQATHRALADSFGCTPSPLPRASPCSSPPASAGFPFAW